MKSCLCIVDGFGISDKTVGNAIYHAKTPNFDKLWQKSPKTLLEASGKYVGLKEGMVGNSEVGHITIGGGRVEKQSIILAEEFAENFEDMKTFFYGKLQSRVNVVGLISRGGLHGHLNVMQKIIRALIKMGHEVKIHAILDGGDDPEASLSYLRELDQEFPNRLVSAVGRRLIMRTQLSLEEARPGILGMLGKGTPVKSIVNFVQDSNLHDGDTPPIHMEDYIFSEQDSFVCTNYRKDASVNLAALLQEKTSSLVGMLDYTEEKKWLPMLSFDNLQPAWFHKFFKSQARISDKVKGAHVSFFFDNRSSSSKNDLVISPFNMHSSDAIIENVKKAMKAHKELIVVNLPHADHGGHTGDLQQAILAVEAADRGLGALVDICKKNGYFLFITSDHGNADQMILNNGGPHRQHTDAPVPFVAVDSQGVVFQDIKQRGSLVNVAHTILHITHGRSHSLSLWNQ
jgi:2,3-bisphosphoglycerate-independent phosphoglycerate mutase